MLKRHFAPRQIEASEFQRTERFEIGDRSVSETEAVESLVVEPTCVNRLMGFDAEVHDMREASRRLLVDRCVVPEEELSNARNWAAATERRRRIKATHARRRRRVEILRLPDRHIGRTTPVRRERTNGLL
jgi:hypothetical protein